MGDLRRGRRGVLVALGVALCLWAAGCGKPDGEKDKAPESPESGRAAGTGAPVGTEEAGVDVPGGVPIGRLPRTVRPTGYALDLTIKPDAQRFSGSARISVTLSEPARGIWLHGNGLTVTSAKAVLPDGREIAADYEQVEDTGIARLSFAITVPAGEAVLALKYNAPFNTQLAGLYRVKEGGAWYAVTQFEAIDARRAFPSFDEPAFKVPFGIAITAKRDHAVIANTPVKEVENLIAGGRKRVVFRTTKPLPTYLVAFAVGPFDIVNASNIPATDGIRTEPVPLRGVAARGKGGKLAHALGTTAGILGQLESYFGVEYPYGKLDLIAAPQYAFGAMENAGAIVYAEHLLLLNQDAPLSQHRDHALVNAHELAHQWFGDLVTPEWWSDIWLNEAFATWMGNKAAHAWAPDGNYGHLTLHDAITDAMPDDELVSTRQIRQPVLRNDQIINAFDHITYQKGGAVLSMFESYLGEEAFRKGVRLHMRRYAHGVANTQQFMESLAEGSGKPEVVPAFSSFIDQPGLPQVTVKASCTNGQGKLSLSQARYRPLGSFAEDRSWRIPACFNIHSGGKWTKTCTLIGRDRISLMLAGGCPSAVMPNADGAGYYRWTFDSAGWRALLDRFASLSVKEALSFADSLDAAWRSGAGGVGTALYFEGMRKVAAHKSWDVATMPIARLEQLHDNVLDARRRAKLRRFGAELYRGRLDAIGLTPTDGEDTNVALLRRPVVDHLAFQVRDAGLRARLETMGKAYVGFGGDGKLHPETTPAELRPAALAVAAQSIGRPFTDALLVHLDASGDAVLRNAIAKALAAVTEKNLAEDIRGLILTDRLRVRERLAIIESHLDNRLSRADAWAWFQLHYDTLQKRFPTWFRNKGPAYTAGFCSNDRLNEVESFFSEWAGSATGADRARRQALERIGLCMAFKQAKEAELNAWLDAHY